MKIPLDIDYNLIQSLSNEVREKLLKYRPATIAMAGKIQGITSASIMAIMIYLKNQKKLEKFSNAEN
jgi:tRNA uridine 5-carboxymethylaminomethyl modification enzyme